jgi:hypothetical protein
MQGREVQFYLNTGAKALIEARFAGCDRRRGRRGCGSSTTQNCRG